MLQSGLNTGDHTFGNIKLRIRSGGVAPLLQLASKQGEVSNKSTKVEDLKEAIVNGGKRLEMLLQYQARLIELEKNSNSNIESLIKIAEQLSQVQTDIEYAQGKKAKLLERTHMDIVHISLSTHFDMSFWGPISDSFSEFGQYLSDGISQVIIAMAYLLPWVFIFLLLLYVVRLIWRKSKT